MRVGGDKGSVMGQGTASARWCLHVTVVGATYRACVAPMFRATGGLLLHRMRAVFGKFATMSVLVFAAGVSGCGGGGKGATPLRGVFAPTGDMTAGRQYHAATLLPNGVVFIAGGESEQMDPRPSAETYFPSLGSFMATGTMPVKNGAPTAVLLPTGKVLVVGGWNYDGSLRGKAVPGAELFDPAGGTFTATGSLAVPRWQTTTTLLADGKVLVAGGNAGTSTLASAELYDPATGSFAATGTLIWARLLHTATLLQNGKVLIVGGLSDISSTSSLADAELYDPAAGTFAPTGASTVRRSGHTATLLPDGKVLVVGGTDGTSNLSSAELYDPGTETFAATGSMAEVRVAFTATLLSSTGMVLLAGGTATRTAELYDPAVGTFAATGTMSTMRQDHSATSLANGKVLIAGGYPGLASAELYE